MYDMFDKYMNSVVLDVYVICLYVL